MANKQTETAARREAQYPTTGIRQSLRIAQIVNDYGGRRSPVPKAVVAQHMKMGESSSAFYALAASAKCFKMVEGNRDLALTEIGQRYFYPMTEDDSRLASIEFFGSPAAFQLLIGKYDGNKLPTPDILSNVLQMEDCAPKSWAPRVAALFLSSGEELGIIDAGGYLRFQASQHSIGNSQAGTAALVLAQQPPDGFATDVVNAPRHVATVRSAKTGVNTWVYSEGGGTVLLETPDKLSATLWNRLKRYVDILEPEEEEMKVQGP